jgi:hypothetical protein
MVIITCYSRGIHITHIFNMPESLHICQHLRKRKELLSFRKSCRKVVMMHDMHNLHIYHILFSHLPSFFTHIYKLDWLNATSFFCSLIFFSVDVNLWNLCFSGMKEPVWLQYEDETDEFKTYAESVVRLQPWLPVQEEKT